MMLGNRGETRETFAETLRFLQKAQPHEYVFSCLSIYPGTKDFYAAEQAGWLRRDEFFKGTFQELKTPFDADEATMKHLNEWFRDNHGLRVVHRDTSREYEAILALLPDYHAAHMDLGAAYYHEGKLDLAEHHVRRALELRYPCPGLAYNHLACIAKARGDLDAMMNLFTTAAKVDPQHWVLIQNVKRGARVVQGRRPVEEAAARAARAARLPAPRTYRAADAARSAAGRLRGVEGRACASRPCGHLREDPRPGRQPEGPRRREEASSRRRLAPRRCRLARRYQPSFDFSSAASSAPIEA